jgi:hypothetical protein
VSISERCISNEYLIQIIIINRRNILIYILTCLCEFFTIHSDKAFGPWVSKIYLALTEKGGYPSEEGLLK